MQKLHSHEETFLPVALPVIPRVRLTFHKCLQRTQSVLIRMTKVQNLDLVLHEYSHHRLLPSHARATAQPLHDHPARKWNHSADAPCSIRTRLGRIQRFRLAKEAHSGEDRDHLVVMGEIDVDGAIEREGDGRVVQRVVGLGVVLDWGFC